MDILRKLGIIKCESYAGVYTNAKERPLEFIDDIDDQQESATSNDTATGQGE